MCGRQIGSCAGKPWADWCVRPCGLSEEEVLWATYGCHLSSVWHFTQPPEWQSTTLGLSVLSLLHYAFLRPPLSLLHPSLIPCSFCPPHSSLLHITLLALILLSLPLTLSLCPPFSLSTSLICISFSLPTLPLSSFFSFGPSSFPLFLSLSFSLSIYL